MFRTKCFKVVFAGEEAADPKEEIRFVGCVAHSPKRTHELVSREVAVE